MVFDKTKAMRNAERYLAQGKIRAAIGEYKEVVDNDPRDFGTMNLLGDLYTKASEPKSAVAYYTTVSEHYSKQGFSQKAIALYNKISKIQPNSLAVSEKLAELYKTKGSVTEAKSHYVVLAENYQAKGRTIEALAMWKQIALLDPTNTEVYLTIAESCLKEGQTSEAVEAFTDAGDRFAKRGMFERADEAYAKALDLNGTNPRALNGFVEFEFAMNRPEKAAGRLRSILAEDRTNRDVLYLLIDCELKAGNIQEAEKTVIKLVEQEPANYPKLLDLANHHLAVNDFEGASRMLTMASEHLLAGGQAGEFASAVRAILQHEPDQLDAVRLLVRFCTWQRDEESLKDSLRQLAEVAKAKDSVEDERFALSQLVMIMPQEAGYAERLHKINAIHGFEEDEPVGRGLFDERFLKQNTKDGLKSAPAANGTSPSAVAGVPADFAIVGAVIESSNGSVEQIAFPQETNGHVAADELTAIGVEVDDSPASRLCREVDSVKFYIDSGYIELAEKAIEELATEFGNVSQVAELKAYLNGPGSPVSVSENGSSEAKAANGNGKLFDIGEFRSELGLEDGDIADDSDFETKYQTATAYQEMGLLEQAIAEFQDAASLVQPNDGTRRFFQCANLLGHCFMLNGMPKLALKWYERALEIKNLNVEEKQALWYELGNVHEAEGNLEDAGKYFEQVYTENVDFRDVSERVKNMMVVG
jgi:tetratricopeptide (TPR) repeat protein